MSHKYKLQYNFPCSCYVTCKYRDRISQEHNPY